MVDVKCPNCRKGMRIDGVVIGETANCECHRCGHQFLLTIEDDVASKEPPSRAQKAVERMVLGLFGGIGGGLAFGLIFGGCIMKENIKQAGDAGLAVLAAVFWGGVIGILVAIWRGDRSSKSE